MTDHDATRGHVAELVAAATSGEVTADAALAPGTTLYELEMNSLGWLRLIDSIESAYGLELDLGGTDLRTATVDTLSERVRTAR
jgi:hypothetical protein